MTTEQAIQKIEKALDRSFELFSQDSDWQPIISTRNQLDYLKNVLEGKSDRSKLDEINIGLISVREFENNYDDFANMIYEVVDIVKLLKKNRL
ncbi:immunity protein Tsi6 family protein [uncultured Chryseobacterium sp.]|jgi:hypothetical protein|uniref:immunity protein Tsi6 family protein n=1 Tax=uncultured Chryseobacterium sp. TaxID=259322 RepID=UPI002603DF34|nr:immunity protein Tsi6 family protein [uncultured Chryseobacterium sp.]